MGKLQGIITGPFINYKEIGLSLIHMEGCRSCKRMLQEGCKRLQELHKWDTSGTQDTG